MVNRSKLLAALVLPPTHKGFPSVALLHAMCAVASNVTSHDDPLGLERLDYWRSEPTPTLYHLKWAKVHTDDAASRGGPLFQVAQAVVLVCFTSYSLARWVEGACASSMMLTSSIAAQSGSTARSRPAFVRRSVSTTSRVSARPPSRSVTPTLRTSTPCRSSPLSSHHRSTKQSATSERW